MKRILYIISILFVAGWLVGVMFFTVGMFIHLFLIVALLFTLQAIIITPKPRVVRP